MKIRMILFMMFLVASLTACTENNFFSITAPTTPTDSLKIPTVATPTATFSNFERPTLVLEEGKMGKNSFFVCMPKGATFKIEVFSTANVVTSMGYGWGTATASSSCGANLLETYVEVYLRPDRPGSARIKLEFGYTLETPSVRAVHELGFDVIVTQSQKG